MKEHIMNKNHYISSLDNVVLCGKSFNRLNINATFDVMVKKVKKRDWCKTCKMLYNKTAHPSRRLK